MVELIKKALRGIKDWFGPANMVAEKKSKSILNRFTLIQSG